MSKSIPMELSQRGRASVDFLAHLFRGSADIRKRTQALEAELATDLESLPDDLDTRNAHMESKLASSPAFRCRELVGEWHARYHGRIAREAFDEVTGRVVPQLESLDSGPASLETAPGDDSPDYWAGVEFHRTAGGWDGSEFHGAIHGELIHRKMVDAIFPGGIFRQRRMVAGLAPRDSYRRILDMGCSTGHFTTALAEAYPGAEIYGVDLSPRNLEHARRQANLNDWGWQLYQRPAEQCGFDDNQFDLVASYILLHELPVGAIHAVFKEAWRVLEPGGDLLMSDVTRYADLDKLAQWRADRGAMYGGEPHWRASASLDLVAVARDAGFVDVVGAYEGPGNYPYVIRGRKPS